MTVFPYTTSLFKASAFPSRDTHIHACTHNTHTHIYIYDVLIPR